LKKTKSGEVGCLLPANFENSSPGDIIASHNELTGASTLSSPEVSSSVVIVADSKPKPKAPQVIRNEQGDNSSASVTSVKIQHEHRPATVSSSEIAAPNGKKSTRNCDSSSWKEVTTSGTNEAVIKDSMTYHNQSENQCGPLVIDNSVAKNEMQKEDKEKASNNTNMKHHSPTQKKKKVSQSYVTSKKWSMASSLPFRNGQLVPELIDRNVQSQSEKQSLISTKVSPHAHTSSVFEGSGQFSPPLNNSDQDHDSMDPEYVYLKAGDDGAIQMINSTSVQGKDKAEDDRSRDRSESLTSQGYVDVHSLGIATPRNEPTEEAGGDDGDSDIYEEAGFTFSRRRSSSVTTLGYVAVPTRASDDNNIIYDKPYHNFSQRRTSSLTSLGYVAVDLSHLKTGGKAGDSSMPYGVQTKARNSYVPSGEKCRSKSESIFSLDRIRSELGPDEKSKSQNPYLELVDARKLLSGKDRHETKKRSISLTVQNELATSKDLLIPKSGNSRIEDFSKYGTSKEKKTAITESKVDMNSEFVYKSIDSRSMQSPQRAAPKVRPKPVAKKSVQNDERDFISRHTQYSIESNDDSTYEVPSFRTKAKSESLVKQMKTNATSDHEYLNIKAGNSDERQETRSPGYEDWLESEADYCYMSPKALK